MKKYILMKKVFHSASFGFYFIKISQEISEILQFNLQRQVKSNRIKKLNVAFSSITFETIRDTLKNLYH